MKTYFEFFAGGGMARAGLGDGWECRLANDFCPKKAAAYQANWGDSHLHVGDIAKLRYPQVGEKVDLAWASFPCQDLSLAGAGLGLEGARSGTFWAFMKLIKSLKTHAMKPPVIALENVYGALTSHSGKDFEAIIKAVAEQGYKIGAMVIDAVHFVPQSRPRLFIVAVDTTIQIPNQITSDVPSPAWHPAAIIRAYNRLPKKLKDCWIWWNLPQPTYAPRTLDDIIESSPSGVQWHSKEETQRLLDMMTETNLRKVMLAQQAGRLKVGTIYRRTRNGVQRAEVRFDGVAGCLRTPSGGSSRQTIIIVNNNTIKSRLLSPREAARLMGLEDAYVLPNKYNEAYHLVGDGVVVPVVAHLARNIFEPLIEAACSAQHLQAVA